MIKDRKFPKDHRQGNLINFVDAIQRLTDMRNDDDYYDEDGFISQNHLDEIEEIIKEIQNFDIIKIGNLYLTSGGRVVLDKGYGENFDDSDKVLFTLEEITNGVKLENFLEKINSSENEDDNLVCSNCKAKNISYKFLYCPYCGSKLEHFEMIDWESIYNKPFKILLNDLDHTVALLRKLGFNIIEEKNQYWIKVDSDEKDNQQEQKKDY